MASTYDTIDHVTLERLTEAGAVRGADVIGQPGGWGGVIKYGMVERALSVRRGAVRVFRHLETLVKNSQSWIGRRPKQLNWLKHSQLNVERGFLPDCLGDRLYSGFVVLHVIQGGRYPCEC